MGSDRSKIAGNYFQGITMVPGKEPRVAYRGDKQIG